MNQMPTVTKEPRVITTVKYSWKCPGCDVPFLKVDYEPQDYEDTLCYKCRRAQEQQDIEQYLAPLVGGEVASVDVATNQAHTIDVPSMRKISSLRLIDRDGRTWRVLSPGVLYIYQEQGERK